MLAAGVVHRVEFTPTVPHKAIQVTGLTDLGTEEVQCGHVRETFAPLWFMCVGGDVWCDVRNVLQYIDLCIYVGMFMCSILQNVLPGEG